MPITIRRPQHAGGLSLSQHCHRIAAGFPSKSSVSLAQRSCCHNFVYRRGQNLGKRLWRIIQWQVSRRVPNREISLSFEEDCWVIDQRRIDYDHQPIHTSLDYQTPAAYAAVFFGFVYASVSRTQPHYQPRRCHSTWCKVEGESAALACCRVSMVSSDLTK